MSDFYYDPTAFADFDPDDDGAQDYPVLPVGEHDFVVSGSEAKESKNGNNMIVLTLEVEHDGRTYKVWDYLTFSEAAKKVVGSKVTAFGLLDELKAGTLTPEMFLGFMGRAKFRHQHTAEYGTSTKVAYYLGGRREKRPAREEIKAEDIPF